MSTCTKQFSEWFLNNYPIMHNVDEIYSIHVYNIIIHVHVCVPI